MSEFAVLLARTLPTITDASSQACPFLSDDLEELKNGASSRDFCELSERSAGQPQDVMTDVIDKPTINPISTTAMAMC